MLYQGRNSYAGNAEFRSLSCAALRWHGAFFGWSWAGESLSFKCDRPGVYLRGCPCTKPGARSRHRLLRELHPTTVSGSSQVIAQMPVLRWNRQYGLPLTKGLNLD